MVYKLRYKKDGKTLNSEITFKKKSSAIKKAKFLRQFDDDLPESQRKRWLKTFRVIKVPESRKIPKR